MLHKLLCGIATGLSLAHAYYVSPPVSAEHVVHCGSTIEEAKQLGCHFDMYSFAYYPPACYNKAHHDDFLSIHRHDINWTLTDHTPIATSEVLAGIHMNLFTTTWNFHDLHCTYEWQRLIRALAEKRPLDKKLSQNTHSYHCSEKLLERDKTARMGSGSEANLLFGACGLTADEMHKFGARSMYDP
jgi:hypothetical protein